MTQMIRLPEVKRLVAVSRSTIYAMVKAGTFPSPKKLGVRAVAWDKDEVSQWLTTRNRACGGTK